MPNSERKFHELESTKYISDHLKNLWALSSAGMPLAVVFFWYVVQNQRLPYWVTGILSLIVLASLFLFVWAVYGLVTAQRELVEAVWESEINGAMPLSELESALKKMWRARRIFIWAMATLISVAVIFVSGSAFAARPSSELNVRLTGVKVVVAESRNLELDDCVVSIREVQPRLFEVHDLTLKARNVLTPAQDAEPVR